MMITDTNGNSISISITLITVHCSGKQARSCVIGMHIGIQLIQLVSYRTIQSIDMLYSSILNFETTRIITGR